MGAAVRPPLQHGRTVPAGHFPGQGERGRRRARVAVLGYDGGGRKPGAAAAAGDWREGAHHGNGEREQDAAAGNGGRTARTRKSVYAGDWAGCGSVGMKMMMMMMEICYLYLCLCLVRREMGGWLLCVFVQLGLSRLKCKMRKNIWPASCTLSVW